MVSHLYVHVPFCARICPYCAFHVHRGGVEEQRRFVTALKQEWRATRAEFPLQLDTIYFGGGTPSLLSPELFTAVAEELPPDRGWTEFTLEVNPATVTEEKAAAWRAAGVNRISLGAQSFDSTALALLGRQHTPDDVLESCALLRDHGFTNLNIDLMFALPGQTEAEWEATLRSALGCEPTHLSAYALTYEEDTPFFQRLKRGDWCQDEDREIVLFQRTREMLAAANLVDYEISNFAKPGFESRHNLGYWRGEDYMGLGPSACSTISGWRWKNVPNTTAYVDRLGRGESVREELEEITSSTRAKERIMFGLRMREGVERSAFRGAEGALAQLAEQGLALDTGSRVCLTKRGQLVADGVAEMFV